MGSFLDKPITDKDVETGSNDRTRYAAVSMQGWRRAQEDEHISACDFSRDVSLFSVFDGHGGRQVSKFAKKYVPDELRTLLTSNDGDVSKSLVDVYHRVDEMICEEAYYGELSRDDDDEEEDDAVAENVIRDPSSEKARKRSVLESKIAGKMASGKSKGSLSPKEASDLMELMLELKNLGGSEGSPKRFPTEAGCTAISCYVDFREKKIYAANAGDSRAVLGKKDGSVVALSFDHKPRDPKELERIERAGGHVNEVNRVNGVLNLSRSLGDMNFKTNSGVGREAQVITAEPDVTVTDLDQDVDLLVLGCDGIWDCLSNEEAVDFIKSRRKNGLSLEDCLCEMLDSNLAESPGANQGAGADNMTIVAVEFV